MIEFDWANAFALFIKERLNAVPEIFLMTWEGMDRAGHDQRNVDLVSHLKRDVNTLLRAYAAHPQQRIPLTAARVKKRLYVNPVQYDGYVLRFRNGLGL